jgi:hypothetical protein
MFSNRLTRLKRGGGQNVGQRGIGLVCHGEWRSYGTLHAQMQEIALFLAR